MTIEQFLELTDREKDSIIAEKVMGWTSVRPHGDRLLGVAPMPKGTATCLATQIVPFYSSDISATWKVVGQIRDQLSGGIYEFFLSEQDSPVSSGWRCRFSNDECSFDGRADIAPLAILIAALKANQVIT